MRSLPDHYAGYTAVLVRLPPANFDVLRDLLGMSHKFVTRFAESASPERKRRKLRHEDSGPPGHHHTNHSALDGFALVAGSE